MPAEFDDTGPEVTWRVKAGDPIVKDWTVTDEDGVAVNLSGATLTGAIRPSEDSALTATATFTMTAPTSSRVKAAYTAGISTAGKYWWAIRVALADGETVYRGQGHLIVEKKGV